MKFLLILWTTLRNAFEASVWATLVWTAAEPFHPIRWIYAFWIFFTILFLQGLKVLGAEPWLARVMVMIDPLLVGSAIWQGVMCALIPAVVTIVVANLTSSWHPDWLRVFLFFACGFYTLWRSNGKRKAVQAWKGEPM
jgi:hypothetical protein